MKLTAKSALAGAFLVAAAPLPSFAAGFDAIYAFGDSLNDCCINPGAPFTNGPNSWLVEFSTLIGASYGLPESTQFNYAVGGAQSGQTNAIPASDVDQGFDSGLLAQLERFKAAAPTIGADDLAVIWVGTNDIWTSGFNGDLLFGALPINKPLGTNPDPAALANYIAGNIQNSVVDLRNAGFTKTLILTPYDVALSTLIDNPDGPARNTAFSLALRDTLMQLYTPGIETWVLDLVTLIDDLRTGSPGNGFLNLSGAVPCNDPVAMVTCASRSQAEQDSFIFNDFVHLTTATNSIIAQQAAGLVMNSTPVTPVPLPSSALLLLGGIGMLAARRMRRAA